MTSDCMRERLHSQQLALHSTIAALRGAVSGESQPVHADQPLISSPKAAGGRDHHKQPPARPLLGGQTFSKVLEALQRWQAHLYNGDAIEAVFREVDNSGDGYIEKEEVNLERERETLDRERGSVRGDRERGRETL